MWQSFWSIFICFSWVPLDLTNQNVAKELPWQTWTWLLEPVAASIPCLSYFKWSKPIEAILKCQKWIKIFSNELSGMAEDIDTILTELLIQAMKTTKTTKKIMRTQNILIINHLLDVTDWKYFNSSPCAASTFSSVVSTLASILQTEKNMH